MWPFDNIGSAIGSQIGQWMTDAFNTAMQAIWNAAIDVLKAAFGLADQFSVFSVSTTSGPVQVIWPLMLWISGAVAVGLFFWQLTLTSLRGGRGFLRLISGSAQYGVALVVTVGLVAAFLAAADGLTSTVLTYGLQSSNFTDALGHTTFGHAVDSGIKAVALGVCAIIGVIPAGIGYVLEMLFREAAIYVLIAAVPVAAAGLLANSTASWFWKTARWLLAAIVMKPVLALALVIGVAVCGGSQGIAGLLAGIGVLLISLFAPFVLFRLFAFVDPNTDAGAGFRQKLSGAGVDSYGPGNPAIQAAHALTGGGGGSAEDANTGRFDDAIGATDDEMTTNNVGDSTSGGSGGGGTTPATASSAGVHADSGAGGTDDDQQPAGSTQGVAANSTGGGNGADDPSGPGAAGGGNGAGGDGSSGGQPPEPPEPGGPPSPPPDPGPPDGGGGSGGSPVGPQSSGGGGGAAGSSTAEEAAVAAL
jgi:hypothetical protein